MLFKMSCLKAAQKLSECCLRVVWKFTQTCPEGVPAVARKLPKHYWPKAVWKLPRAQDKNTDMSQRHSPWELWICRPLHSAQSVGKSVFVRQHFFDRDREIRPWIWKSTIGAKKSTIGIGNQGFGHSQRDRSSKKDSKDIRRKHGMKVRN